MLCISALLADVKGRPLHTTEGFMRSVDYYSEVEVGTRTSRAMAQLGFHLSFLVELRIVNASGVASQDSICNPYNSLEPIQRIGAAGIGLARVGEDTFP